MLKPKLLLLLFGFFAISASAAYADEWRHTWNIGDKPEFVFRSNDAGVDISARPGKAIEAYVETKGRRISDSDVHITERQSGDHVEMEVHVARHFVAFGYYVVKISISVPENTQLRVNTDDGHIRVDGVKAEQRLETGDGSIESMHADGNLWAHTKDGHIKAGGRFDRLDLSTNDGHIELGVDTGSKLAGTWEVHTHDGSVRAALPADLAADMEVDTGDGHIDSDLTITVQGGFTRNRLRGALNGGGPLFRIHTGDGSIRLSRS